MVGDADGQMSLMWGADVEGGLAEIRSTPDGTVFPSPSNVSPEQALIYLPLSPFAVPEPTSAVLLLIGASLLVTRRMKK